MIILINGSINSGKSTVSKLLAKKMPNTAHIEIDKLREFVDFMTLSSELIKINLQNAALVANNFLNCGLNVIISYPLSTENYKFLTDNLNLTGHKLLTFTLNPKLSIVTKNRGSRRLKNWEVERIKHHYKIKINNPEFENIVIDNTNQTPEETVVEMLKYIK